MSVIQGRAAELLRDLIQKAAADHKILVIDHRDRETVPSTIRVDKNGFFTIHTRPES